MTSNASLVGAAMLLMVLLALLGYVVVTDVGAPKKEAMQIANPASTNCVQLGGVLDIRADASGAEAGYCRMPDGRECEEWALFRDGSCVNP